MTYSGKFTITKEDNRHYNFFRMKRKLAGLAMTTFLILALLLMLVRYSQGISVANSVLTALLVAVAGTALMVGFNLISVVLRVDKLYKTGQMSDFAVYYIVDKTGVHAKSERGDTDFAWKQILLARETSHAFYLVAGENRAAVIPKKQIPNDGEINVLRALLRKYVPAGRVIVAK